MNALHGAESQFPFSFIDLRRSKSFAYGEPFFRHNAVQHTPHCNRVKHIKDLVGNSICVVETAENVKKNQYPLSFPPNNYNDRKLKNSSNSFKFSAGLNPNGSMTGLPALDTVFSLKHFTGLQNITFKNRSHFTMKRIDKFDGWQTQLHELTDCALEPIIKEIKRPTTTDTRKELSGSMRKLYSSSGRIIPTLGPQRFITTPGSRPSTAASKAKSENVVDDFDFDKQVFYILGGVLQTTDQEVVKIWLLTATDRERALMVDIVRGALLNKQELDIFVKEPEDVDKNLIIYTPDKNNRSKLSPIKENENFEASKVLQVHSDPLLNKDHPPNYRPPTSSTFKSGGTYPQSRPPTRDEQSWVPSESIVVN